MKTKKKTRTDVIRDYLASLPESERGPTEVAAALKAKGCKVTRNHVSVVKSNMGKNAAASMARRLLIAKRLIEAAGGAPQARQLIGIVGRIVR